MDIKITNISYRDDGFFENLADVAKKFGAIPAMTFETTSQKTRTPMVTVSNINSAVQEDDLKLALVLAFHADADLVIQKNDSQIELPLQKIDNAAEIVATAKKYKDQDYFTALSKKLKLVDRFNS